MAPHEYLLYTSPMLSIRLSLPSGFFEEQRHYFLSLRYEKHQLAADLVEGMIDPSESARRLEMHVKRVSSIGVTEEPTPAGAKANMTSPDVQYIGSRVGQEDGFPAGTAVSAAHVYAFDGKEMRRRGLEPPLGSKVGYHELDDEKEEADEEWMLGEASQLSGAGTRGSRNWVLKVMLPILLIAGIICMHNWWTEVKQSVSDAANAVGDVFDRRALLDESAATGGGGQGGDFGAEGQQQQQAHMISGALQGRVSPKAVYSVGLGEVGAKVDNSQM